MYISTRMHDELIVNIKQLLKKIGAVKMRK